jgi:HPt (histidine-containing phosphotransfer) domain-containing protein
MSNTPNISEVIYDAELPVMDREQIDMLLMVDDGEDSTSLVRELFQLFNSESAGKLDNLDVVCQANDLTGLRRIVHFIAGSAGNLGMARLCAFYRGIECAIDENRLTDISNCADVVRTEFKNACEAFIQEFGL